MVFHRIWNGLRKTRERISGGLRGLFGGGRSLDRDFLDELEEVLYTTDMGSTATKVIERVQEAWRKGDLRTPEEVHAFLHEDLLSRMTDERPGIRYAGEPPTVMLVVGVNGSGKTTSIAKLAWWLKGEGHRVLLCAGDTFRAAAVEQLSIWAERIGVPLVKGVQGADPAAVAFDAAQAAVARGADVLIVDTAGRLHTQANLMKELEKIRGVLARRIPGAPHEVLLVLDATTGQNAVQQARQFKAATEVSGLFLAKLDGTAKGGAVVDIREQVDLPVKFVGLGEKPEDIDVFKPDEFVKALLQLETEEVA